MSYITYRFEAFVHLGLVKTRISGVTSKLDRGRLCHSANIIWEENQRPNDKLWFKIDSGDGERSFDLKAHLIGLFPFATLKGERRISIPGPISRYLNDRLIDLHGWWINWGFTKQDMPTIEAPRAENVSAKEKNTWVSSGFLSGGVDSLHMLDRNLKTFPMEGLHRITDCILITGLDTDMNVAEEGAACELANKCLMTITSAVGVKLIRAETNLRGTIFVFGSSSGTSLRYPVPLMPQSRVAESFMLPVPTTFLK